MKKPLLKMIKRGLKRYILLSSSFFPETFREQKLAPDDPPKAHPVAVASQGLSLHHS
jgi:hypothetical protein